jgi:hypothetical protein
MDEISRGIATAAPTLQSVMLQALVPDNESQSIPPTQQLSGSALRFSAIKADRDQKKLVIAHPTNRNTNLSRAITVNGEFGSTSYQAEVPRTELLRPTRGCFRSAHCQATNPGK